MTETETNTEPRRQGTLVNQCMVKAMRAIEAIEKSRKADAGAAKYNFRGIDEVYNGLHDILADAGLYLLPSYSDRQVIERETRSGAAMFYVTIRGTFRFVAEDGSYVECSTIGEGMDTSDKATNKAMSVSLKYALMQVFMIPTVEPKDPENDHHEVAPKKKPEPKVSLQDMLRRECIAHNIKTADAYRRVCSVVIGKPAPEDDQDRQKVIDWLCDGEYERLVQESEVTP